MNKDSGKYLHKYYKKKILSFLTNLHKLIATNDPEIIHKLRVDIKKIKMLFNFLEILMPKKFNAEKQSEIFENIFKQAGEIRETQINRIYINHRKLPASKILPYLEFINKKEKKYKSRFLNELTGFQTKEITKQNIIIKKISKKINKEKIIEKLQELIFDKVYKTKKMLYDPENKNLHKVRKDLKSISFLSNLLFKFSPARELQQFLKSLKDGEEAVGSWHDRIIFEESLRKFIKSKQIKSDREKVFFVKLLNLIKEENKKEILPIIKKIRRTLTNQ
jgi:CHAD domain-containing protein